MVEGSLSSAHPRHRPEGFDGQRLLVLPASVLGKLRQEPLFLDLFCTASGYFPYAEGHLVKRRRGIADTILIRVLTGAGWVEGGLRQEVKAGEMILIPPQLPHAYGADERRPWTIEWIHFDGRAAAAFTNLLGAEGEARVMRGDFLGVDFTPFSLVYDTMARGYTPVNLLKISAHVRMILTEIHDRHMSGNPTDAESRVRRSMDWMSTHPAARTTLEALSRAAGLSVPHYCFLFRKLAGYPPMEHLRRLNIQRACELLHTTNLPVGQIAERLGWEDPMHFSRRFRGITGKSPKAWRDDFPRSS